MALKEFKQSQMYIRKMQNLIKLGFDFNNDTEKEYLKIQSLLYTEYHINCESMLSIMKKFNIPSSKTMDTLFKLFDIESRNFAEANKMALLTKRREATCNYNHVSKWHTSWFGENFYLRSSYEIALAEQLDTQKVKYFVEHLRIKYFDTQENKYRIAIPDFYLPETNTIIEVKSAYWLDEINMQNKKLCYEDLGYKFKLYLDHKIIDNWSMVELPGLEPGKRD